MLYPLSYRGQRTEGTRVSRPGVTRTYVPMKARKLPDDWRHVSFRFALDPTAAQKQALARHSGASRFAYNQGLAHLPLSGVRALLRP